MGNEYITWMGCSSLIAGGLFVFLHVLQFGHNFAFMSAGVVMVGVLFSFLLRSLLPRFPRKQSLVLVVVEVLVLVEVLLRHDVIPP